MTVSFRLEDQARAGWDRVATENNVTLTALIEALGRLLEQSSDAMPPEVVNLAQRIDRERRNRREDD